MADILGNSLVTVEALEGAAYGAALLAGVGAGIWPDVGAATAKVQVSDETHPGKNQAAYEGIYATYRSLYPTLKETFARLAG
jgi:xylulokinase